MSEGVMDKAVDFAVACYRKNPNISMGEMKKLGAPKGINIYPLVIGKAKTRLGMGKAKPAPGAPKRGPGRPRKNPAPAAAVVAASSTLGDVAAMVQRLDNDLRACQAKLAQIAAIAAG